MIARFVSSLSWRGWWRASPQVVVLRAIAVLCGLLGPLVFFPVGHTRVEIFIGAAAMLASLIGGFVPGTPIVTGALLLFAGQVAATADGRSQGTVLVLALAGTSVLWTQHMVWTAVNAVPADAAIQPGAFRVVAFRAAALLVIALVIDVLVISATDAAQAGSSWRWVGFATVALFFLAGLSVITRRRRGTLRG